MCCLLLGILKLVDVLRYAGVGCPPVDHVDLEGNNVDGFNSTAVFG